MYLYIFTYRYVYIYTYIHTPLCCVYKQQPMLKTAGALFHSPQVFSQADPRISPDKQRTANEKSH